MDSDPREVSPESAIAVSPQDRSPDRTQSDADQLLNTGKLDELINTSRELTEVSAANIAANRRQRRRDRMSLASFCVLMVALSVIMVVVVSSSHNNGKVIKDCVDTTGQCFKQAQARSAKLIAGVIRSINTAALTDAGLAAACAPNYVRLPMDKRIVAIHACILRHLK